MRIVVSQSAAFLLFLHSFGKPFIFIILALWIKDEINKVTYDRWYSIYSNEIRNFKGAIERLGNDQSKAFSILEDNLNLLTDLRHINTVSDTLQKRDFVNRLFDSNLYYENGIYRTPTILGLLSHNHLKMKEKDLLI